MIELDVSLVGEEKIQAFLRKGLNLDDAIARGLGEWASDLLDSELYGMENYAPPPAKSKYIRTGRLGSNWGLQRQDKTGVVFLNQTPYAGYVVADGEGQGQAGIHQGRWWLGRRRIEAGLDGAIDAIGKEIVRALD